MRSSVPDGDLGKIIDQAVTEKLERLEARRYAKTKKPRKTLAGTDTTPKSRHIPAAVRRVVEKRDGGRCAFRDPRGRRCSRRHDLEFHHRTPFGKGGHHTPENLALMCRAHNGLMAEGDYGAGGWGGTVRRAVGCHGGWEAPCRREPGWSKRASAGVCVECGMARLTVYLDEETKRHVGRAAKAAGVSQSRWLVDLVRRELSCEWPAEVHEWAGSWPDFPEAEDLRSRAGRDVR